MAAAYAHAVGSHNSKEINELRLIEKFGVEAVKNRRYLGADEIRSMVLAENVEAEYRDMTRATDWATWAKENESAYNLIEASRKAAKKLGLIED